MSILASWCSVKLEYLFSVTSVCLISTFKIKCVYRLVCRYQNVYRASVCHLGTFEGRFSLFCVKKMELQEEFVFISRSHLIISDRFNVDRSDS